MSETEADEPQATPPPEAVVSQLNLEPLPLASLPPAVQKVVTGATPAKTMAAKGLAPLKPAELGLALYQLAFDAEEAVRNAAHASAAGLPDRILLPILAEALPGVVLHFFAGKLPADRVAALEVLLFNLATADESFALLAERLHERELEIICQAEARFLRSPAIVVALYRNKDVRQSAINRVIELCVRNNVRVAGIPAFDEVARSISDDPTATTPAADSAFATVLEASEHAPVVEDEAPVPEEPAAAEPATPAPVAADAPRVAPRKPREPVEKRVVIDFTRLKLHEKIRLATLGNASARSNLLRDPNKTVAMAAIKSPRISDSEVAATAGNKQVCEEVIRYIANSREYSKVYAIRLSLAMNPKCPVQLSVRFLSTFTTQDIKKLAASKSIPQQVQVTARRIAQTRSASGK